MLTVLNPFDRNQPFPDVSKALDEPNGLLAIGGCLSPHRLENAYRKGIFPWFGDNEPILWWSPNPRLVMWPDRIKISRSLAKRLRRNEFEFTVDQCFDEVLDRCSKPRNYAAGTWITRDVKRAYGEFHRLGFAHSFESWKDGKLVGGLYGVALGRVFFGESMFHEVTDASKAAFAFACQRLHTWSYALIDCQVHTGHLVSLGAEEIARTEFVRLLEDYGNQQTPANAWKKDNPLECAD